MSAQCDYSFGIEEEFFLVRPHSRLLATQVPARLLKRARAELGECIESELLQAQIEIASPVQCDIGQARRQLGELRRGLAELAHEHGLALLAAGTHPLGQWREQSPTDKPRYRQLVEDFQIVARRSQVCGLHVHVQLPDGVDRVQAMNRAMPWLPLLLALSTSSPFWDRLNSGLMSYRQAMYDEWPRTGIPDFFAGEAEYDAFADLLTRAGAIADAGSLWWAIRPSPNFPTVELRIADACTHLDDSLAIAALFRCLMRHIARHRAEPPPCDAATRRLIDENRWRAKRSGLQAEFIDARGGSEPALEQLRRLRELVAEDAAALDCTQALRRLDTIAERGTSAHAQLAIYREHRQRGASRNGALKAVVDWLLHATVPAAADAAPTPSAPDSP
ncbi:carboxylate-amine ligase [Lysobacter yananisis]|uniref:Putative glutamate--cysteine ligase 2 n=1 Tax=Lysobacter yananisis TaxID=1003114 RepID=A0ABY9P6N7_9GAMM|nr:carboxylate-amine ligase [Lysobacter yananisis]WMT02566.1 carboxylate-amine ligase [Lysobacter yananisis]